MRRAYRRTDRFGRPLRAPRPGDYRPAPAPKAAPLDQCWHGLNESWIPRCTEKGTYRLPDDSAARHYSSDSWTQMARYCPGHAPDHAIPVDARTPSRTSPHG